MMPRADLHLTAEIYETLLLGRAIQIESELVVSFLLQTNHCETFNFLHISLLIKLVWAKREGQVKENVKFYSFFQ